MVPENQTFDLSWSIRADLLLSPNHRLELSICSLASGMLSFLRLGGYGFFGPAAELLPKTSSCAARFARNVPEHFVDLRFLSGELPGLVKRPIEVKLNRFLPSNFHTWKHEPVISQDFLSRSCDRQSASQASSRARLDQLAFRLARSAARISCTRLRVSRVPGKLVVSLGWASLSFSHFARTAGYITDRRRCPVGRQCQGRGLWQRALGAARASYYEASDLRVLQIGNLHAHKDVVVRRRTFGWIQDRCAGAATPPRIPSVRRNPLPEVTHQDAKVSGGQKLGCATSFSQLSMTATI